MMKKLFLASFMLSVACISVAQNNVLYDLSNYKEQGYPNGMSAYVVSNDEGDVLVTVFKGTKVSQLINVGFVDINTIRALEEGLENFAGCAVVISHDRWFLDRIATHILAFEGDSKVYFFEGTYSEYEENKKRRLGDIEPKRFKYKKLK